MVFNDFDNVEQAIIQGRNYGQRSEPYLEPSRTF